MSHCVYMHVLLYLNYKRKYNIKMKDACIMHQSKLENRILIGKHLNLFRWANLYHHVTISQLEVNSILNSKHFTLT